MTAGDLSQNEPAATEDALREEIARLNKIVQVLMDRAERSTSEQVTAYGVFQATIVLEDLVQRRTEELRRALDRNERITRTLRESEARFRGIAEQPLAGIAIWEQGRFTYVNTRFAETFGYSREEILAISPIETIHPGSRPLFAEHIRKCLAREPAPNLISYVGLKKDGTTTDIDLSSSRMELSDKVALVHVVTDVTARRRAEREVLILNRRLAEQAIRDPLTSLYNRRYMEESIERELLRAERTDTSVSVIMCDIDDFKDINDRYGHQVGDSVLQTLGSLFKQRRRGSDIASRYGGEEFLLVFPDMPGERALEWAEEMRATIAGASIRAGGTTVAITASFGVAVYPAHGSTADEVISAADKAQYAAKEAGKNRVAYAGDAPATDKRL